MCKFILFSASYAAVILSVDSRHLVPKLCGSDSQYTFHFYVLFL